MLILSQSQSPALSPAQSQAQNYISQQPVWFTPAPCPQSVHLLLIPPRYIDCHQSHHNCLVSLQFLQSSNLAFVQFPVYLPANWRIHCVWMVRFDIFWSFGEHQPVYSSKVLTWIPLPALLPSAVHLSLYPYTCKGKRNLLSWDK